MEAALKSLSSLVAELKGCDSQEVPIDVPLLDPSLDLDSLQLTQFFTHAAQLIGRPIGSALSERWLDCSIRQIAQELGQETPIGIER